jgi:hypothetical protein
MRISICLEDHDFHLWQYLIGFNHILRFVVIFQVIERVSLIKKPILRAAKSL